MKKYLFTITISLLFILNGFSQEKYDFIVAKDGSGNFTTIQSAIDACKAFPDDSIKILVRNGIYSEKILVPSCNTKLSIIGESAENTIITWNDFFNKINRGRNSTFYTWTLKIEASDFRLENITVENSSGPVGQAVALHVEGDRCVFINCRLLGNQDTLYTAGDNSRQYFKNCFIEGTTDFIFGEATVLFSDCTLNIKADSYYTAASTPKDRKYGYVFLNCKLIASDNVKNAYLGRPWRDYARVVFIKCYLDKQINDQGWKNWDKTNRDQTAFYAEYENTGPGSNTENRVKWSKILTKRDASKYKTELILKGFDGWNPEKLIK